MVYENRKIWRWADYYKQARENYARDNGKDVDSGEDLYNLTIKVHDPYRSKNPVFHTDEKYLRTVDRLHEKCKVLFQNPQVYDRKGMAYGLKDNWVVQNELNGLIALLKPQLERDVFGSYVHVDNVKVYRSFVTNENSTSSWLWHIDNAPKEQIKILIYLTDVEGDGDGQFEFITDGKSTEGIKIPTGRVSYDDWVDPWEGGKAKFSAEDAFGNLHHWAGTDRVPPSIVNSLLSNIKFQSEFAKGVGGCKLGKVTGKRGKLLLFDNNIIHRATTCRKKHRDVVVFQFKPSLEPVEFSPETCGNGWEHMTFNVCPSIQKPLLMNEANNIPNQRREISKLL